MATKNDGPVTVDQMRTAIAALTGKPCVSKNETHLRKRLDELLKLQAAGRHAGDTTTVVSISMHGRAKDAAARIAKAETAKRDRSVGVSEIVREALASWAASNGYKAEATNFEVE